MYLALYRKYRPRTFDDVISQEHITTTLKNQIINGSAGHAYLFTGSRGTGKTTCAKIFSMALNCEHPENGSPCMRCERCLEILEGATPDVVEMDAASNRGVEDVRRLRDEVVYTPVTCKYRVYIIDEVHMLTTEAFNALLKTLEEPPSHVKFILATTELHKVPATISSRCQRFEFRRVDINDSAERLIKVAEQEGLSLDKDAAELISRLSDGGMRDALSVLDRCGSSDEHITVSVVRDCAGIADNRHLFQFSEMIAARNTAGCIRLLGELHKGAKDISLIISNLIEHYRDLMIYKTAPNESDLLFTLPDERGRLVEVSSLYSMEEVLDCITLLSECSENIGRTRQRKTLAEMCFVKMCARGSNPPMVQFAQNAVVQNAVPVANTVVQSAPVAVTAQQEKSPVEVVQPVFESVPPVSDNVVMKSVPPVADKADVNEQLPPWDEDAQPSVEPTLAENTPTSEPTVPTEPSQPHNDVPPPPWDEDVPPLPEPPPEQSGEYLPSPPMERFEEPPVLTFDTNSLSGDDYPINTEENLVVENAPERKPFSTDIVNQWSGKINELANTDFMLGAMLKGSTARCADGVVVITSTNSMLLNNVVGDELTRVEQKLNDLFAMTFHIRIERGDNAFEQDENSSAIEDFLNKAKKLGITVTIKE